MRPSTRVMVSEVHPLNLLLFWVLSFFAKVEAYKIHRMCPRSLSQRLEVVDLGKYLSWSESHYFKSRVVQLWEETSEHFPSKDWIHVDGGLLVDFITKAKQDLGSQFEQFLFLQEVRERSDTYSRVLIVDSPAFRYLRKLDPSAEFSKCPTLPVVSQINIALDLLFTYLHTLSVMVALLHGLVNGCLHRDSRRGQVKDRTPFLWDAVNVNELTFDPSLRYFPWIVDGKRISREDIIFVLPPFANRKARPDLESSGYSAFTILELYSQIPPGDLLRCLRDLLAFMVGYILPWPRGLRSIQKAGYVAAMSRWKPVVQHLNPACYVTSVSRMGYEDPATVYLNAIGVQTVMYYFSGIFATFVDEDRVCDFKQIILADILAACLVVWHKNYGEHLHRHSQEHSNIKVVGPLMAGEESVFESPPDVLRKGLGIAPNPTGKNLRYISIFDVAVVSKENQIAASNVARPNTEEYSLAFLKDMMRLLEDFDDIALVFKPKRSLEDIKFSYDDEFHKLLEELQESGRGVTVQDDINPWVPIAVADLCIGMPFTSPPLAAMHHGIPGLFHDPSGIVRYHAYKPISDYVTHDYEELRSSVHSLLVDHPRDNVTREKVWAEAREFIGEYPGTSSTDRFRDLLCDIAGQTAQK